MSEKQKINIVSLSTYIGVISRGCGNWKHKWILEGIRQINDA